MCISICCFWAWARSIFGKATVTVGKGITSTELIDARIQLLTDILKLLFEEFFHTTGHLSPLGKHSKLQIYAHLGHLRLRITSATHLELNASAGQSLTNTRNKGRCTEYIFPASRRKKVDRI